MALVVETHYRELLQVQGEDVSKVISAQNLTKIGAKPGSRYEYIFQN